VRCVHLKSSNTRAELISKLKRSRLPSLSAAGFLVSCSCSVIGQEMDNMLYYERATADLGVDSWSAARFSDEWRLQALGSG
jgi:hypothetical protein